MKIDNDLKCYDCEYMVCENCQLKSRKLKNKYRKLQNYAYYNLEKFGNTVLSKKVYDALGKAVITKDLKDNGFKDISIVVSKSGSIIVNATWFAKKATV